MQLTEVCQVWGSDSISPLRSSRAIKASDLCGEPSFNLLPSPRPFYKSNMDALVTVPSFVLPLDSVSKLLTIES